jgi:integrase
MPNLTKSFIDSLAPTDKDQIFWDDRLKGFGVKVTPKGKKVYLLKYRNSVRQQRKPIIGVHRKITCEQARLIAQNWFHELSQGNDPFTIREKLRSSPSMSELCDRYLTEHARPKKKPGGVKLDEGYIDNYIKPRLGNSKAAIVSQTDIVSFHRGMHETPAQANRILATLSKMFNLAEKWGIRELNSNPVRGIDKYPEKPKERFLSVPEIQAVHSAISELESEKVLTEHAAALFRLLMLTGARRNEILTAKWEWVDLKKGLIALPDSKTGKRPLYLPPYAIEILSTLPRVKGNPYIIVGKNPGTHFIGVRKLWLKVLKLAKVKDVRLHDLRHTYAAQSIELGVPLFHVGKMLGHKKARTTERYAHLANDPLQLAVNTVGESFSHIWTTKEKKNEEELRKEVI